ncbi:MAG: OmpA family protein [Rhodospirillaceae bacterium]|jgi:OmpA-OmpF porin, OOP family|nr:OmpA family protein [Rhodospirillaceae bacterium]MBT7293177.1 OmpA family protein [Rhodospirillaceae bacterium]
MRNLLALGAMAVLGGLVLSACTNNIETTRNLTVAGEGFSPHLAQNYRELTLFEADKMYDWPDAWLFADKALAASRGAVPTPEQIADWRIPESQIPPLTTARAELVSAIDAGFARQIPVQAALAQSSFDCWIEQLEEGWQLGHIENCRSAFETALEKWRVRQITSETIPAAALLPLETAGSLKISEQHQSTCTAVSQAASDSPVDTPLQRFRVQFTHDSAVLDGAANEILDAGAALARDTAIEEVFVQGHADRSGLSEHNLRLSMRRALAVWEQLIARGVSPHKIWIGPRGEAMPETETADGEKNADNRRVLIFLKAPSIEELVSAEDCTGTAHDAVHMTDVIS